MRKQSSGGAVCRSIAGVWHSRATKHGFEYGLDLRLAGEVANSSTVLVWGLGRRRGHRGGRGGQDKQGTPPAALCAAGVALEYKRGILTLL
jgi:hypothetical protein